MTRTVSFVVGTILFLLVCPDTVDGWFWRRRRRSQPRDTTPPTLTCPTDIVVNNLPGRNYQQVPWVEPLASDNGRTIKPTRSGPAPGQNFTEGVVRIIYRASDSSGNTASCTFTVTVNVIRCPKIQRQTNGHIECTPSDDMVYGGVCRFGCYSGFDLNGPSTATCLESGQWNVTPQPTCKKKICPTLYPPPNVKNIKCTDAFDYRSICHYTCREGYGLKLGTSSVRVCDTHGDWIGAEPSCIEKTCPTLYPPPNVKKITCTDAFDYRSICHYTCREGYGLKLGTSSVRVCDTHGDWIGAEPSCIDMTRPVFTDCPYVISGLAEPTKKFGTPTWPMPSARDSNNGQVWMLKIFGPSPGDEIAVGKHRVFYLAIDSVGNTATCIFNVIVTQIHCPPIYPAPYTRVVCSSEYILGSSCNFSCDEGAVLQGESNTECRRSGQHVPYGTWSFNDNQPYCELDYRCPSPIPPANGAVAVGTFLGTTISQMSCQKGFVTEERDIHIRLHFCNSNGNWTFGNELPDCRETKKPERFGMHIEYTFYNGTCTADHAHITKGFQKAFEDSLVNKCIQNGTCELSDIRINCGEHTQGNRGRRDDTDGFTIKVNMTLSKDLGSKDIMMTRHDVITTLSSPFTIESTDTVYTGGRLSGVTQIKANCSSGYVFDIRSNLCIQCKRGYYKKNETSPCTKCTKGTYQELAGKAFCKRCPEGKTTALDGTISVEMCLEACSPGMYSKYGTAPCFQCGIGTYASMVAATTCIQCPGTKTTLTPGSTSLDQCQD